MPGWAFFIAQIAYYPPQHIHYHVNHPLFPKNGKNFARKLLNAVRVKIAGETVIITPNNPRVHFYKK